MQILIKFQEKIKNLYELIRPSLTIDTLLNTYHFVLNTVVKIIEITTQFLKSVLNLLALDKLMNLRWLFKLTISLTVYSKLLLITSNIISFPPFLLTFMTDYWNNITQGYIFVLTSIKDAILEIESYESISKEQYLDETHRLRKTIDSQDITIRELKNHSQYLEKINDIMTKYNSELIDEVKVSKTVTVVEKGQKWVTILSNTAIVGIQAINAYNSFFTSGSSDEMKALITTIQKLSLRVDNLIIDKKASQRATTSAASSAPSAGLTSDNISFTDQLD